MERGKKERGPARDRTGIAGIRIQSDDHYTTEPYLLILSFQFRYINQNIPILRTVIEFLSESG